MLDVLLLKMQLFFFGIYDYFLNRQNISNAMLLNLQTSLAQVYTTVPAHKFQLRKITFPDAISEQFLTAAITAQQTLQFIAQQQADIYRAQTALLVSSIIAASQIVNTSALAQISQIGYEAGAQAYHIQTSAEGYGIADVFETLNISDIYLQQQYLTYYRVSQNNFSTAIFGLAFNQFGTNSTT